MLSRGNRFMPAGSCLVRAVVLSVALLIGLAVRAQAAPPDLPGVQPQAPVTCAECHAEEYTAWQDSTHAAATSTSSFQTTWERTGRLDECLACHTTGYDPATGEMGVAGVTCLACHTTDDQNHPPALMSVDVSSEACGECHRNTLAEWQLSGHGDRGVECIACHRAHSQELRIEPAKELCRQCHGRRLEDLAHTSHAGQDLTCTSCHMPENPAAEVIHGIGSINPVGHTFSVGAQTCAQCHQNEIHGRAVEMAREVLGSPELSIAAREREALEAAYQRTRTLSADNQALEQQLLRQRILTYVGGAFGFGVGAFVGVLGALVLVFVLQRRGMA